MMNFDARRRYFSLKDRMSGSNKGKGPISILSFWDIWQLFWMLKLRE